jgi:hypothetical protein
MFREGEVVEPYLIATFPKVRMCTEEKGDAQCKANLMEEEDAY